MYSCFENTIFGLLKVEKGHFRKALQATNTGIFA